MHTPATRSAAKPDPVLILGAGLMGRLLAVSLAQRGAQVELVDAGPQDASRSAARVAAAMLAPLAESIITEPPVVAMGMHALNRWPELIHDLARPVYFQREGTLIVWHRQDAGEARRFGQHLTAMAGTIDDLSTHQNLDATTLATLEPALAQRFQQGYFLPGEGQLDNRQLLDALLPTLQQLGVSLRWNTPLSLAQGLAEQATRGGWLLDCRGLGAQTDWAQLRGVRGEVIRLHAPGVNLRRPTRLLHPRYPLYIAPKPDDLYVVGATEIESEDDSPASVRSVLELLSAAYTVHPGFGEARILEINTQCRPTLRDNLPAIRQVGPRALQVNGLYRHGFLIAPALLDATLEWMLEQGTDLATRLGLHLDGLDAAGADHASHQSPGNAPEQPPHPRQTDHAH